MIYETYSVGGVLYHHGIKGQKWGKRNGPPYPLNESSHSYSEKKANYKQSLTESGQKKRKINKKLVAAGAIAAGVALAGIGGYYLYKSGKLDDLIRIGASKGFSGSDSYKKVKKAFGTIENRDPKVNVKLCNPFGGKQNCNAVSSALLVRSNNGINVVAKNRGKATWEEVEQLWPGAKHSKMMPCDSHSDIAKYLETKFKDGDNGILGLTAKRSSKDDDHMITWFIENGKTVFRDAQPSFGNGQHGLPDFNGDPKFSKLFEKYNLDIVDFMQVNNTPLTTDINILNKFFKKG